MNKGYDLAHEAIDLPGYVAAFTHRLMKDLGFGVSGTSAESTGRQAGRRGLRRPDPRWLRTPPTQDPWRKLQLAEDAAARILLNGKDEGVKLMQCVYAQIGDDVDCLELPAEHEELMPGVRWGGADELFTPAFWKAQAWQHALAGGYGDLRLGRSLVEEAAACLLGGYGMPAELGLAAFARLQALDLLRAETSEHEILCALSEPLIVQGRTRSYRFARQKARYLAETLVYLHGLDEPQGDVDLRDALTDAIGVGPKTASWVVRNYRASDRVAILDIHIMRACALAGLFASQPVTAASYRRLEQAFLAFADALQVRAGMLDGLIWDYMRRLGGPVRRVSVQLALF